MHMKTILVATTTGNMPVLAGIIGALGVHPHIGSFDQWAITHIGTGFRLKAVYPSRDAAERAAVELDAIGDWDALIRRALIDKAHRDELITITRAITARHDGSLTTADAAEIRSLPLSILCAVIAERARQDAEWGGPEHDDRHSGEDWQDFLFCQVDRMVLTEDGTDYAPAPDYRERLVKVIALGIAALESHDRKLAAASTGEAA